MCSSASVIGVYKVNNSPLVLDMIPASGLFCHCLTKSIKYRGGTVWRDWSVWCVQSISSSRMAGTVAWRSAAKTLDMQPRTKSPLFPWGWNSEVFENQLMFSIYCPLYVPCNSPAPWAQLDRQTPKGAVSLGKAWPISFPSDVRTPLNCRVGLLHRHWFGMTVLQWHASALWPILKPVGKKQRKVQKCWNLKLNVWAKPLDTN